MRWKRNHCDIFDNTLLISIFITTLFSPLVKNIRSHFPYVILCVSVNHSPQTCAYVQFIQSVHFRIMKRINWAKETSAESAGVNRYPWKSYTKIEHVKRNEGLRMFNFNIKLLRKIEFVNMWNTYVHCKKQIIRE